MVLGIALFHFDKHYNNILNYYFLPSDNNQDYDSTFGGKIGGICWRTISRKNNDNPKISK